MHLDYDTESGVRKYLEEVGAILFEIHNIAPEVTATLMIEDYIELSISGAFVAYLNFGEVIFRIPANLIDQGIALCNQFIPKEMLLRREGDILCVSTFDYNTKLWSPNLALLPDESYSTVDDFGFKGDPF